MDSLAGRKAEIEARFGRWTAHNLRLPDGSGTLDEGVNGSDHRVRRALQAVSDLSPKPLSQCRVLDLGCLEGLFTLEMAGHGANALGVDVREANLAKAEFVRSANRVSGARFEQSDVRRVSKATHGVFDIILCIGLLYHLDHPDGAELLSTLAEMCEGLLYLDTRISVGADEAVSWRDRTLHGRRALEHEPGASPEHREAQLWSSVDNDLSFWFTRPSLVNVLQAVGFSSVYECHAPALLKDMADRASFIAVKRTPVAVLTTVYGAPPLRDLPER